MATKWLITGVLLGVLGFTSGCVGESPAEDPPGTSLETNHLFDRAPEETVPSTVTQCAPAVAADIEAVIRAQTEALSRGDFQLAHSYASASFRRGVGVGAFEALIVSDYAPLFTASRLEFSSCLHDPRDSAAAIEVQVGGGGDGVFRLRYVLVESEEGWRVNEASNLELLGNRS